MPRAVNGPVNIICHSKDIFCDFWGGVRLKKIEMKYYP